MVDSLLGKSSSGYQAVDLSFSEPPEICLSLLWASISSYYFSPLTVCGRHYHQTHDCVDESMKQFQQILTEVETEAENLLLARQQLVENDRLRNGNREALTALRRRAKTTKTSVPLSAFEELMKEVEGTSLVKEVCATCGNHDSKEKTWMMFPGTDVFARIPFHASHSILEKDQVQLDFNANKLQSFVKEKSLWISEKGLLADKISPGLLKSMVTLTDSSK